MNNREFEFLLKCSNIIYSMLYKNLKNSPGNYTFILKEQKNYGPEFVVIIITDLETIKGYFLDFERAGKSQQSPAYSHIMHARTFFMK